MKTVVIIQARMGSKRFPDKVMADLCGKPVIRHVVDRAIDAKVGEVIVAVPDTDDSEPLWNYLVGQNVRVESGHPTDVLMRFWQSVPSDADYIARLTGDCPLVDSRLIRDQVICLTEFEEEYDGYIGRCNDPDGSDVEVFTRKTLSDSWLNSISAYDREHVTPWMQRETNFVPKKPDPKLRFSVDTPEDLATCAWLIEQCGEGAPWQAYIEALKNRP